MSGTANTLTTDLAGVPRAEEDPLDAPLFDDAPPVTLADPRGEPITPPTRYPWSGRLSFSLLKMIAPNGSPAHFLRACKVQRKSTTTMRRGTMAHFHLFGVHPSRPAPTFYLADKVADPKAWKRFQADHAGEEIFSPKEDADGRAIAEAIRTAPHNRPLWEQWIRGAEYEVPLEWDLGGIPFRTRGVDVVKHARSPGEKRRIVDFKTARSTEPRKLGYQIRDMHYFEQLATYDDGMRAAYVDPRSGEIGFDAEEWAIFATDPEAPHVSTVVQISAQQIQEARGNVFRWVDLLRNCLEKDDWPGYEREPVFLDGAAPGLDVEGLEVVEG